MTEANFTPAQCRAARAAVQWDQKELAERARVSRATLVKFENGSGVPSVNNLIAIRAVFEAKGFRFAMSNEDVWTIAHSSVAGRSDDADP